MTGIQQPWLYFGAPLAGMLGLMAVNAMQPLDPAVGYWLLGASLLFFGLPHGALDVELARKLNLYTSLRQFWRFILLYLLGALFTLALCLAAPMIALALFLALTIWHWGTAESICWASNRMAWITHGLARGAVIVGAPIYFHADEAAHVLTGFLQWFGQASVTAEAASVIALPILLTGFVVDLAYSILRFLRNRAVASGLNLVEAILLPVYFALTPAVIAVAYYFIFAHAFRHMLRVAGPGQQLESARLIAQGRRLLQSHGRHMVYVLIPILIIAAVASLRPPVDPSQAVGLYLALLFCLTTPHAWLVARLDRRSFS